MTTDELLERIYSLHREQSEKNQETLEKIYNIQNDTNERMSKLESSSKERDTKLEGEFGNLSERMEKTENTLERIANVMEEQKHISSRVDASFNRIDELKAEDKNLDERITVLERLPANKAFNLFHKIIWIVIPLITSAICSFIFNKINKLFL